MSVKCDFCGRIVPTTPQKNDDLIFLGSNDNFSICGTCIRNGFEIMNETNINDSSNEAMQNITPKNLKNKLDEWIIDQELAKKRLSIAVYDHFKRVNQPKSDEPIEKSNILLVGSTGCGKTAIMKALSKELNLPLYIEDVTSITTTGYVGRSVDDILSGLLAEADGNLELAQKGIILLDEGDKLRRTTGANAAGGRDVKGEGVQQGLLKITEGGVFTVNYKKVEYKMDTSNILFVLAGAFEGIEKIISKRKNLKSTVGGFTGSIASKTQKDYNQLIMDVKPEDLKEFGMMPELLGRFPIITPLQELSEEALIKILTEPKGSIVKQMIKNFKIDNVKLKFDKEALTKIAKKAKERKVGARALRSIVEEVIENAKYDCPGSDIKEVVVKEDLSLEYIKEN